MLFCGAVGEEHEQKERWLPAGRTAQRLVLFARDAVRFQ
jgi:hypothetical protein